MTLTLKRVARESIMQAALKARDQGHFHQLYLRLIRPYLGDRRVVDAFSREATRITRVAEALPVQEA